MTQPDPDLIKAREGRVCAYCLLDHEVHGGCFTGKRPSELRSEMNARLAGLKAGRAEREGG